MSDAADSTLNTVKTLLTAFKTGATPPAPAAKTTAEPAYLPPPFPVEVVKPGEKAKELGRLLLLTKIQAEDNYARQIQEDMALRASRRAARQPGIDCAGSLHISLFFDGTGSNQEDADDQYVSAGTALTSIGKLYRAANWSKQVPSAEDDWYFSHYFPGCGARFSQIGEDKYSLDGELFGNGGEDRINQALLKTLSNLVYAVTKTDVSDSTLTTYRQNMASTWPASMMSHAGSRKKAITEFFDAHLGPVVNQWPQQPTREYIQKLQKRILKIKLFVYGYCRGASTARVFARWLEELLDNTPMPLDTKLSPTSGSALPPGPTLLGIPISIEFMGLMDSVSSVGVPHILPSATGHLGWAANNLRLPATPGFVKSCHHFVAGHEQHGDLPLDSIRGPDGKYPAGAVEVVYPGVHADIGGDCKSGELGKSLHRPAELLPQIALHDMYAGAPLSVPEEVLPAGLKKKTYRIMQPFLLDKFKIADSVITGFNAWQTTGAAQDGEKPAGDAAKSGTVNVAGMKGIGIARGEKPEDTEKRIGLAQEAAAKKADADKKEAQKKADDAHMAGTLSAPVYTPLKAKPLETLLADQISWITAWRSLRFFGPQHASVPYRTLPFYAGAKNEGTDGPRAVPVIDRDRLDRSAGEYHRSHSSLLALLGEVALDIIPTTATDKLGGKAMTAQESAYMQIKKSGDARRPALLASPPVMKLYDDHVHDTVAKYNHDPLHSSLTHGYFAPRTVYDHDDDRWDSVKQFGQRIKAVVDIHIGDIVKEARTDMENPSTVSGVLGKIYRDIRSEAFKTLGS